MKETDFDKIFQDAHELELHLRKQQAIEEAKRDVAEIQRLVDLAVCMPR